MTPIMVNDAAIDRRRGFTLLEVLVALIIFSIAFGAIAGIFQTALRQSTTAETLLEATAAAERQIERFGADLPLRVGETSGISTEGLSWKATVALARPPVEGGDLALYRITVEIGPDQGEEGYVTLETLKIGRAP